MGAPSPIHVVHVASEVAPLSQSGGLGMVLGALPREQRALGAQVSVITPLYRSIDRDGLEPTGVTLHVTVGHRTSDVVVWTSVVDDVPVYLLDCPEAYDREGMYGPRPSSDFADNAWRFALLCEGALEACRRLRLHPDIIHCHDWQTGLLPLWCRERLSGWVRTVLTVHNLGYQGTFPADTVEELGLDRHLFHPDGIEFWGWLSFLKAGLVFADTLTTVSPTYAEEVRTARFGNGLDGVMRARANETRGILNGIDPAQWDPQLLEPPIRAGESEGRDAANARLRSEFGLERGGLVVSVVSRLVPQKGADLVPDALRPLLASGDVRVVIVGDGDVDIEDALSALRDEFPGRVHLHLGYDDDLARRVLSGSDALLMPSRYEPCGLTQMFAMRYGTLPIVRRTGGLADTVQDGQNGFTFDEPTSDALQGALVRFLGARSRFAEMRQRAMGVDLSWTRSARQYIKLYEEVHGGE